jgi:hypothetical protein
MANMNETQLRGKKLTGSEQKEAVDHGEYAKQRNPDSKLRLDDDGEADTLYDDGLEVDGDSETLADTHGERSTGG